MSNPLVSICCITYNHERFIAQCLEGFLMQKTNFTYEILIHDDASQDLTKDIIRCYTENFPHIIKPIYQTTNLYSKGISPNIQYNYPRARGKYIAICEGDDYWTDNLKLQNQVDLLEKDSNCAMVYSKVQYFYQAKNKFAKYPWGGGSNTLDELLLKNRIPTLTVLLRTNLVKQYLLEVKPEFQNWKMGDYPLWLYISMKSKIIFLDKVTGVYRVLEESASHSKELKRSEDFIRSSMEIKRFFYEFANKKYDSRRHDNHMFTILANNAIDKNNRVLAKKYYSLTTQLNLRNNIKKFICNYDELFFIYIMIIKPNR